MNSKSHIRSKNKAKKKAPMESYIKRALAITGLIVALVGVPAAIFQAGKAYYEMRDAKMKTTQKTSQTESTGTERINDKGSRSDSSDKSGVYMSTNGPNSNNFNVSGNGTVNINQSSDK